MAELSTSPTTFPIPTKGTYITFKSGGGTHEAHVSVRSVASVALSTEPAKVGGHDLHVMRLLGVGGGPILSLLVAWAEGEGPGSYVRWLLSVFALQTGWGWVPCSGRCWRSVSHPCLSEGMDVVLGGMSQVRDHADVLMKIEGLGREVRDDALVQTLTTTGVRLSFWNLHFHSLSALLWGLW